MPKQTGDSQTDGATDADSDRPADVATRQVAPSRHGEEEPRRADGRNGRESAADALASSLDEHRNDEHSEIL